MASFFLKRGGRNASFFILLMFLFCAFEIQAFTPPNSTLLKINKISSSPTWKALIHTDGKTAYIKDTGFLLTQNDFSPQAEMHATIAYLYSDNIQAVCRFPARYLWLQKKLDLPVLDTSVCTELIDFENRAPIDIIHLVFASENIAQPSSMMGHVLTKISGLNGAGVEVSHAISFYTNIEGLNLAKIFYENIVSGNEGYFSLSPYDEKISRYNRIENRNVWEYELNVSEFRKKLLQYHFYEIKQTKLDYYFHSYNCATLTHFFLEIASNQEFSIGIFGVSPVDTVKTAESSNLITKVQLVPSRKWHMRMLTDNMSKRTLKYVKSAIRLKSTGPLKKIETPEDKFIAYDLLKDYIEIELESRNSLLNDDFYETIKSEQNSLPKFNIDLSSYKSPTKTPADSQISVGTSHFVDDELLLVNLMPTSHRLEDDNRQYFGESSLTLGDLTIARSTRTGSVFIDSFTLYGVKSLMPSDHFTGGISGSFRIGSQQELDSDFKRRTTAFVDGALGKTYQLSKDIKIYALLGSGIASTKNDFFVEATPELGIVIAEIFNMKSIIQYQHSFTDSNIVPDHTSYSLTQSIYLQKDFGIVFKAEDLRIADRSENIFSLWVKHYF